MRLMLNNDITNTAAEGKEEWIKTFEFLGKYPEDKEFGPMDFMEDGDLAWLKAYENWDYQDIKFSMLSFDDNEDAMLNKMAVCNIITALQVMAKEE